MFDSHTHRLSRNAIVDLDPVDMRQGVRKNTPVLLRGYTYSVGIHPWNVFSVTPADLRLLRSLAASPSVIAIGETGLDAISVPKITLPASPGLFSSPSPSTRAEILASQTALLQIHYGLSEALRKPLILHIVKAFPEIIALKKSWRPSCPWIIHGFRGKPQLARELLAHGFYLSFGSKYNPEALALTPPSRLLRETDAMPG